MGLQTGRNVNKQKAGQTGAQADPQDSPHSRLGGVKQEPVVAGDRMTDHWSSQAWKGTPRAPFASCRVRGLGQEGLIQVEQRGTKNRVGQVLS